ncbi:TonB-dependent receptor [Lacinutrix sp. MedPE-SW]|uniref:TonB-dependent receptor n=1 Tax=Lacinutrix sp. MedPE-SW TaxID=1860087 RepID=UPI000ACF0412|nr:TonB-dependent receptor [Lacinutrix sp. MedPE-SW]
MTPYKKLIENLYLALLLLLLPFTILAQDRASIIGNVSDEYGPLPGANVSIEGTNIKTTTNLDGDYSFNLEEGDYVLSAEFIMYEPQANAINLKVGDTLVQNFILKTGFSLDEPISLGSRVKPQSTLKNTAAVDIISPQEITNSTQIELSHLLHYLVPSFHSTNQTIADGTDHIDPATLRGLGPDQLLVLINGKRRHNSALLNVNGTVGRGTVGTDFNAIPVAAIERIEILRDGATSQYGSDAIAGVINIILKQQTEIINIDGRFGINTEGDGKTVYMGTNFGFKVGNEGFINVSGEYRNRGAVNRAGNYTGAVYSNDPEEDQQLINENNFFNTTGYDGKRIMEIGSAETENLSVFINSELPISNNASFYFHGGRNYREGKAKGFFRLPKDEDRVVLELFPNGFSPEILTDIQDDAVVMGFKGVKNLWNLDFSHSIGKNSLDYTVNNSNNASLGIASPKTFYSGGFKYKQSTSNLDISRSYDWLKGLNIALGAELRVENYEIIAGEEASYINGESTYIDGDGNEQPRIPAAQVFPGIQPENELSRFRTNSSAYVDIETSVTKKLLIKTAARYESYNDFGDQLIYKLSSRYALNDNMSFRAGYSTGFRAPSLHQVYFQNISSQFINGEIVQVGTFNNESAVALEAFKIEKLKPELSKHFNAGVSGKINKNFTYTFDFYHIKIKNRIVLSGRFAEGYETILQPFNVGAAQFFTNAIDSETNGFDTALNYRTPISNGTLDASFQANFTRTKVVGPINVPESLNGQEDILFNREEIARVEKAQPNFKLSSLLAYKINKFKIQLNNTYFGEVEFIHPNDGDQNNWVVNNITGQVESRDQTFSSKLITDLHLSYQINKNVKLTLGGNNIFNIYPDKHTHSANIGNGNFVYSRRVQQFGVNGANYFLRALIKL